LIFRFNEGSERTRRDQASFLGTHGWNYTTAPALRQTDRPLLAVSCRSRDCLSSTADSTDRRTTLA